MFTNVYLKNVVTLQFDKTKCNGCRMCIEVCPHAVFKMENRKAKIVNRDRCMECGACQKNCAQVAIQVQAGVGCAAAVISSIGKEEVSCGCSDKKTCCS
jgi:ferredoxin